MAWGPDLPELVIACDIGRSGGRVEVLTTPIPTREAHRPGPPGRGSVHSDHAGVPTGPGRGVRRRGRRRARAAPGQGRGSADVRRLARARSARLPVTRDHGPARRRRRRRWPCRPPARGDPGRRRAPRRRRPTEARRRGRRDHGRAARPRSTGNRGCRSPTASTRSRARVPPVTTSRSCVARSKPACRSRRRATDDTTAIQTLLRASTAGASRPACRSWSARARARVSPTCWCGTRPTGFDTVDDVNVARWGAAGDASAQHGAGRARGPRRGAARRRDRRVADDGAGEELIWFPEPGRTRAVRAGEQRARAAAPRGAGPAPRHHPLRPRREAGLDAARAVPIPERVGRDPGRGVGRRGARSASRSSTARSSAPRSPRAPCSASPTAALAGALPGLLVTDAPGVHGLGRVVVPARVPRRARAPGREGRGVRGRAGRLSRLGAQRLGTRSPGLRRLRPVRLDGRRAASSTASTLGRGRAVRARTSPRRWSRRRVSSASSWPGASRAEGAHVVRASSRSAHAAGPASRRALRARASRCDAHERDDRDRGVGRRRTDRSAKPRPTSPRHDRDAGEQLARDVESRAEVAERAGAGGVDAASRRRAGRGRWGRSPATRRRGSTPRPTRGRRSPSPRRGR